MFGVLKNVSAVGITLMNMRLKKIKYTFDSIAEVYLDTIV
jgi:hypothetical protein